MVVGQNSPMKISLLLTVALAIMAHTVTASEHVSFTSEVKGCGEAATNMAVDTVRSAGNSDNSTPRLSVDSCSILYHRTANHQCCRKVEIRSELNNQKITITEWWTGDGCRCYCSTDITATVSNLTAGQYSVTVVMRGIVPQSNGELKPVQLLDEAIQVIE